MTQIAIAAAAVTAVTTSLYGLHRWRLWLEARELLYYKHKRPESSAAGCFVALQQAIDPASMHVMQVMDEKRHHSDEEAPGEEGGE